jgi:hypothetical protein
MSMQLFNDTNQGHTQTSKFHGREATGFWPLLFHHHLPLHLAVAELAEDGAFELKRPGLVGGEFNSRRLARRENPVDVVPFDLDAMAAVGGGGGYTNNPPPTAIITLSTKTRSEGAKKRWVAITALLS